MPKHLTVTQASVTALLVWGVGQAVAFVPSVSNSQQILISTGSLVIAAVFAALHLVGAAVVASKQKATLGELEGGVRTLAKDEIGKINLTKVAEGVISAHGLNNVEQVVRDELNKILVRTGLEQAKVQANPPGPESAVVHGTPVESAAPAAPAAAVTVNLTPPVA
jgi:hypothetical protein